MCKTSVERNIPAGVDRVRDLLLCGGRRQLKVALRLASRAHIKDLPDGRVGIDGSFRGYHYKDGKPTDKPNKDGLNDHAMDAIRYWAVTTHGVLSEHDLSKTSAEPTPLAAPAAQGARARAARLVRPIG